MKAWKYYRGEWTEIEDPLEWNENEEWETALSRAGYHDFPTVSFGGNYSSLRAELYEAKAIKEDHTLPYLITFSFSSTIEDLYIDDVPSLMQWLRDYTPLFSLPQIAETQDGLQTLFERAFRAWHGHSYIDVCPKCDPMEFKRREEAYQRRNRAKSQKGG